MTDKYAGHTPNGWVIQNYYAETFIGSDSGHLIATVSDYRNLGKETHEANARLIADAPKLLEENKRLREALKKLACLGNGNRWGNSIGNQIAQEALKESEDED